MSDPWLIIGLGNPETRYARNRHNVGHMVVDVLAGRTGSRLSKHKARAQAAEARIGPRLAEAGYRHGIIFRAFNDGTLGFAPPICISQDEIDLLIGRVGATLAEVTNL